jgi:hypothetical protein
MSGPALTADAAMRLRPRGLVDRPAALWCAIVVAGSAALGMSIAMSPATAIALTAGLVIAPLLFVSSGARLVFVVVGGITVLNVSEGLTTSKVVYLVGCCVAVVAVLLRLGELRQTSAYALLRPLLQVSFAFAAFIVLATGASIVAGNSASGAVRDSAAYLLFACIPVLALDSRISTHPRLLIGLFVLVGVLGSVSFALQWISRRGLTQQQSIDRLALSGMIPGAVLCLLTAAVLLRRRRLLSAAGVGVVAALVLITGNRGGLLLFLGPLTVIGVGTRGSGWLRIALIGPLAVAVTYLSFGYLVSAYDIDRSALTARYASLTRPSDLAGDQSLRIRLVETRAARAVFESHLLIGAGPGYLFTWTDPLTGIGRSYSYIDSPLQYPAKFGIVGLLLLGTLAFKMAGLLRASMRAPDIYRVALVGFSVSVLVSAIVQRSPIDDKGLSMSLLLLFTLSLPLHDTGPDRLATDPLGLRESDREERHPLGQG